MKVTFHKKPLTKEKLQQIYDTCNRIFKDEKYFYTREQVKELKKDKSNVWLWLEKYITPFKGSILNGTSIFLIVLLLINIIS